MQKTTIYLEDRDRQAIKEIMDRYGSTSESAAIRFAVRALARSASFALVLDADQPKELDEPAAIVNVEEGRTTLPSERLTK
jgi:hypothetical protein